MFGGAAVKENETPDISSVSLNAGILTINFANGESFRWEGVPQAVADVLGLHPTFAVFATVVRPNYKLLEAV